MGAAEWLASGSPLELGFLPFPLDQALLPGETRQVHLYEARFITLFSEAASKHHDCLGAVLFTPQGNVASVTSLLEIEEFRTGAEEIGVWANLKCVGRVKLKELETTEFDYLSGGVELFTDSLPTEERAEDDAAAAELRELHASVREMEERLTEAGEGAAVAEAIGREARVEWGHEVRDGSEEAGLGLEALVERRSGVLRSAGQDAPPRESLLAAVASGWGVESEEEAQRQLLSFSASATLSPSARAQALGMRSGAERLAAATAVLKEQQRRLSALLMLRDAGLEAS